MGSTALCVQLLAIERFIVYQPSWAQVKIASLDALLDRVSTSQLINRKELILQISAVTNKVEYAKFQLDELVEAKSRFVVDRIVDETASMEEYDNHALCRCYLELLMLMLHGSINAMARLVWLIYELSDLDDRYINLKTGRDAMVKNHGKLNLTKFLQETSESPWYSYLHEIRIQLEHGDTVVPKVPKIGK